VTVGSDWCCRCLPLPHPGPPVFDCVCAYIQAFGTASKDDDWYVDLSLGGWAGHDQEECYNGNTSEFCEAVQGVYLLNNYSRRTPIDNKFGIFGRRSPCSSYFCCWLTTVVLWDDLSCQAIFCRVSLNLTGEYRGGELFWWYECRVEIMLANYCFAYGCGIYEATYRSAEFSRDVQSYCDAPLDPETGKIPLTKYEEGSYGYLNPLCEGVLPDTIYTWRA